MVVPDEEQFINEIPEPRNGQIRRIINGAIATLLGAPPDDLDKWAAWSDEVVQGTYPTKYRNERGEGLAVNVFLDRVRSMRTLDVTRHENVPVFWAHGPRELLVELDRA